MAGFHDHTDSERLFPGCPSPVQRLERGEVAEECQEGEQDRERQHPTLERRPQMPQVHGTRGELQQDQERDHDQGVHERRRGPGAHAGQLQPHGDVLGGLDVELLAQLRRANRVSRWRVHVLILSRPRHRSESRMPDLRPRDFGEILDGSLMISRRHFGLFLRLAVTALSVPLVLLVYFVLRALTALQQNPVRALLYLLPIGLVYYVASLVLTTGTIRIISDSYLGREPQLRDALSLGWSKIWPLTAVGVGKGLLAMLILLGGRGVVGVCVAVLKGAGVLLAVALVAAGTWFLFFVLCGYGVTTPVVVLEELRSSFDAFGRSWELTRSFKLKVAGLFFVGGLLTDFLSCFVFRWPGSLCLLSVPR